MAAVTAALMAGGLAASAYGAYKSSQGAKDQSAGAMNIANLEIQEDQVRRQAMQLMAHRQTTEVLRNSQRARATALGNAVGQGAQFGSGLQGGYGQIGSQTAWNTEGISQNLQLGNQIFDINGQIDQQRIAMAQAGTRMATGQGISGLGSGLMGAAGPMGQLSQGGLGNMFGGFGGSSGGDPMSGL
jgi:hypothetical protein